jgi:plasmid stabilization system protein ParE
MAKVIWDRQANDDLDGIITYIDRFDPAAADRIGSRLYKLGESLADFPERGRPVEDGTREMPGVRPYVLSYVFAADTVTILRVRHGRQRR